MLYEFLNKRFDIVRTKRDLSACFLTYLQEKAVIAADTPFILLCKLSRCYAAILCESVCETRKTQISSENI